MVAARSRRGPVAFGNQPELTGRRRRIEFRAREPTGLAGRPAGWRRANRLAEHAELLLLIIHFRTDARISPEVLMNAPIELARIAFTFVRTKKNGCSLFICLH